MAENPYGPDVPWWAPEAVTLRESVAGVLHTSEWPFGPDQVARPLERIVLLLGAVPPTDRQLRAARKFRVAADVITAEIPRWNGGRAETKEA